MLHHNYSIQPLLSNSLLLYYWYTRKENSTREHFRTIIVLPLAHIGQDSVFCVMKFWCQLHIFRHLYRKNSKIIKKREIVVVI